MCFKLLAVYSFFTYKIAINGISTKITEFTKSSFSCSFFTQLAFLSAIQSSLIKNTARLI